MLGAPSVPSDRSHLCSGARLEVIPAGRGSRWEGRYLQRHFQITSAALRCAGIPVTELHQGLLGRLGRIGLEIERFERRLYDSGLTDAELRRYQSLNTHYLAVLRGIVSPPRAIGRKPADEPSGKAPPSLEDILVELAAADETQI